MINVLIKKVISFCLVGAVLTSCQSWKFKCFQFPIVLRWPIDIEYFKNSNRVENAPQRPKHEAMPPKVEQKVTFKNKTAANKRKVSKKKAQNGVGSSGKKESKPGKKLKRAQDVIPLW